LRVNFVMAAFTEDTSELMLTLAQQMKARGLTSVAAFRAMDANRGGTCSAAELHAWTRKEGLHFTRSECDAIVRACNGGRGGVDFASFSRALKAQQVRARRERAHHAAPVIQPTSAVRAAARSEFAGAPSSALAAHGKALLLRGLTSEFTMPTDGELARLWARYDMNGNGELSLAEIDRAVGEALPGVDRPALMRAYKFADADGSGFISRREFRLLLRSLVLFQRLWKQFAEIDDDGDRRVDLGEFARGAAALELDLSADEATAMFEEMDCDGGGFVLFHEFCSYMARLKAEQMEDAAHA